MAQGRVPKGSPHGGVYSRNRNPESTVDLSSAVLPDELVKKMPPGTSQTWLKIAPLLPGSAYLSGGTALTVHLLHRVSRDLDIFLERPEDLQRLWIQFQDVGEARATQHDDSTITCVIDDTKVQVLDAATLKIVSPFITVGGMRVASVNDILAMKLKVIVDRGELRLEQLTPARDQGGQRRGTGGGDRGEIDMRGEHLLVPARREGRRGENGSHRRKRQTPARARKKTHRRPLPKAPAGTASPLLLAHRSARPTHDDR